MSVRMKIATIKPAFVEFVPEQLEEGVLYVSKRFQVCSHKCCCGCGEEVVTPLSKAAWTLTEEGDEVSLWPSVGNWDFKCRSHYVIRRNQVLKSVPMTDRQIARVQQRDATDLARMVAANNAEKDRCSISGGDKPAAVSQPPSQIETREAGREGLWRKLRRILRW